MRRPSRACAKPARCCIGKTTTPEFGWKGSTDSPLTGITRNPWNKKKTPGGSSGGSSAALAARLRPLALGTDGGGSIRIPASFTATYGLKPSFGRVAGLSAVALRHGRACRTDDAHRARRALMMNVDRAARRARLVLRCPAATRTTPRG